MTSWPCTILVFMALFDDALQCVTPRCGASLQVSQPSNDFLSLKLPSPPDTPYSDQDLPLEISDMSMTTAVSGPASLCKQCRAALRVQLMPAAPERTAPSHRSATRDSLKKSTWSVTNLYVFYSLLRSKGDRRDCWVTTTSLWESYIC